MSFQKASALPKAKPVAQEENVHMLSFCPDEETYFFIRCHMSSKAALPLRVAVTELARACCVGNGNELLICPSSDDDGFYFIGSEAKAEEATETLLAEAAKLKVTISHLKITGGDSKGVPSGIIREVLAFSIVSHLFQNKWSTMLGTFVHRFDRTQAVRAGVSYSVELRSGGQRVAISLLDFLLRGSNSGHGVLAPGATRYSLPNCSAAHLVEVLDHVPHDDKIDEKNLHRYWQTLYGIHFHSSLFARVRLGDSPLFTYPMDTLLATPILKKKAERPGSEQLVEICKKDFLKCILSCHVFATSKMSFEKEE